MMKKIVSLLRKDMPYFLFCMALTLIYGIVFLAADFYCIPCQSTADYMQLLKYFILAEIAILGLFTLISINKYVFAVAFPTVVFMSTVMTYYRYTVKATLTPQIVDLIIQNDLRTSMHAVSWQLILLLILSIVLSIYIVRYRIKKISAHMPVIWLLFSLSLIYYTNTRGHLSTEVEQRQPYNLYYSVKEYLSTREHISRHRQPFRRQATTDTDTLTVLLIIGESLRADHLQVNGYHRPTTPLLSKEKNLIAYPNVITDYVLTHLSIPHILTRSTATHPDRAYTEQSFITLLRQAGYTATWIANQESIPTYAYFMNECDSIVYASSNKSMYLFDSWLDTDVLPHYHNLLGKWSLQFILLHTVGSHWYYDSHYPQSYRRYTPTTTSRVISGNTQSQMINSYDNTILFSDYVWHSIIEPLRNTTSVILYISDHGESLGEQGYYTHGVDRPEQHNVACWLWYSDKYAQRYPDKVARLRSNSHRKLKTYFVFPTILDIADIKINNKINK